MINTMRDALLKDLRKKILHERYNKAKQQVVNLVDLNSARKGLIVPLLGPTRCGKSELLDDLKTTLEADTRGGNLFSNSDFIIGRVPAIPNAKSLNSAMLGALGLRVRSGETTSSIRERLVSSILTDGISISAIVSVANPCDAIKLGAFASTRAFSSLSCSTTSSFNINQRRAKERMAALAEAVVHVIGRGLNAAMCRISATFPLIHWPIGDCSAIAERLINAIAQIGRRIDNQCFECNHFHRTAFYRCITGDLQVADHLHRT